MAVTISFSMPSRGSKAGFAYGQITTRPMNRERSHTPTVAATYPEPPESL